MSNYIPNGEKKNRMFTKRVRNLVHALQNDFSGEKIAALAEKVREAKMGVFKCRYAEFAEPHTFSPEDMAANNEQVHLWISMSTADIIELCQSKCREDPAPGCVNAPDPNPDALSDSN